KTRKDGTVVVGTHANGIYSAKYDTEVYTPKVPFFQSLNAKVYPNPSDGIFNIEIEGEHPGDYLIAIYDMQGKPVYFSEQKNVLSINQQIDLQKHAKGIYNVEIVKGGRASSYKVVLK
ncbi:MAG: T9SS type A sorting domain-containing protein, partial [Bacteroidota bacterium]